MRSQFRGFLGGSGVFAKEFLELRFQENLLLFFFLEKRLYSSKILGLRELIAIQLEGFNPVLQVNDSSLVLLDYALKLLDFPLQSIRFLDLLVPEFVMGNFCSLNFFAH